MFPFAVSHNSLSTTWSGPHLIMLHDTDHILSMLRLFSTKGRLFSLKNDIFLYGFDNKFNFTRDNAKSLSLNDTKALSDIAKY